MPRADITIPETAVALRLIADVGDPLDPDAGDPLDPGIEGILSRHITVAADMIEIYAESAPMTTKNEAVTRIVGYLYESSPLESGDAFVTSGARKLLSNYHQPQTATVG